MESLGIEGHKSGEMFNQNTHAEELLEEILMLVEATDPQKLPNYKNTGRTYYGVFGRLKDGRDVVYHYGSNSIHLVSNWDSYGNPVYNKNQSLRGRSLSLFNKSKELTPEQQIVSEAKAKYKNGEC